MQLKKFLFRNVLLKINFFYKLYIKYNINSYKKKSINQKTFSQQGEDIFINEYFKNDKKGLYVDIGCYHPFVYSNTFLLYQKKWTGINIDLNQASIDLFNIARPNDINICAAISNENKYVDLYFHHKFSAINTINEKFNSYAKKNISKDKRDFKKIKAHTFNSLCEKYVGQKNIDFLNIDVEGSDSEVLEGFDLKKFKPKLICVEIHDTGELQANTNKCLKILNNNGYYFIKKTGVSSFFEYNQ